MVAGKDRRDSLHQIFLDFDPAGLAPGDYTLLLDLVDPTTGTAYARAAPFGLIER